MSPRVYERVDRPLVAGDRADGAARGQGRPRLSRQAVSREFAEEIAALEERIYEAACGPFTIGSPQQLGEVLYERLGLKGGRKGKSGAYSTDVNELERLAGEGVECARLVLDWRQLTKLKIDLHRRAAGADQPGDRAGPHQLQPAGAQTGRLASNDPNLQNIPIRTEIGRKIRDAFVAEPGHVLMSADYSQIELRLAAHMADVPQLKEAFRDKADIHNLTAEELFGSADRDNRNKAKTINFAILYGISSWGLAGRLGIPQGRRQGDHRPLFRALPRHPHLHLRDAGLRPRERLHPHPVRPQDAFPQHPLAQPELPRRRRAGGDQRADPGDQRRPDQAGDGADGRCARGRRA